jgi:hypothetical protein
VTDRWINKSRAEGHSANGYRAGAVAVLLLTMSDSVLDDVGLTTGPLVVMPETGGTCTIAVVGELRLHPTVTSQDH